MNLILLFPEDFIPDTSRVHLKGRRLQHVQDVHRAQLGNELCVGLIDGRIGTGKICLLNQSALEMEVHLHCDPPPPLPLTLVMALPRPKVLKRVLITATSMGVKEFFLVNSWRVEKSFWKSPVLGEERLREALVLGLEQAKDTRLPRVELRSRFKPFVEDELPALAAERLALVAHPTGARPCPRNIAQPAILAIGPEGGFIPYEVDMLSARGFAPVTLGERILRVEAAVPALLSRLY